MFAPRGEERLANECFPRLVCHCPKLGRGSRSWLDALASRRAALAAVLPFWEAFLASLVALRDLQRAVSGGRRDDIRRTARLATSSRALDGLTNLLLGNHCVVQ